MGWRDRAKPVESGGWRSRAKPIEQPEDLDALDAVQRPTEQGDSLDFMKADRPVGAFGGGVQQGVTLGFADEMTGAAGAVEEGGKRLRQAVGIQGPDVVEADPARNPNGPEIKKSWGPSQPAGNKPVIPESVPERPSLADTYRSIRDRDRTTNKKSQAAQPLAYGAGELAGGAAVPIPGSGLMKGAPLVAKVGLGAAQAGGVGAVYGVGKSEAEDVEGLKSDAIETGLVAAPFGAAAPVAGHALGKLGERFGAKAASAKTAEELRRLDELRGSTLGSMRQAKGEAIRLLERATADANNPRLSPAARARAAAFLDSPEGKRLAEEAAASLMEQAPEQMGRMASTKSEFLQAPAEAAKQSAEYFGKNTIVEDVLPRVAHYAKPALSTAAGGMLGGPAGAAAGGLLGVATGKPGRALANLTQKTPRFTVQANEALQSGANASETALQNLATQLGVRVEDLADDKLRRRFGGE